MAKGVSDKGVTEDRSLEGVIVDVMQSLVGDGVCAWGGCAVRFAGELPPRWTRLTIAASGNSREMVLCPKHAAELDGLLKGVSGPLGDILADN